MVSISAVSAFAPVHQPLVSNRPVPRSNRIISAVAAAVRRSPAFQVVRAQDVQASSGRSPALPQARSAPTPRAAQSSTLYMPVRQLVPPAGIRASPRRLSPDQVRPPSNDRSSHTSSPACPFSTDAQPIASVSLKCSTKRRPCSVAVTGCRSVPASAASRPSQ
jgi:hypothetical protein